MYLTPHFLPSVAYCYEFTKLDRINLVIDDEYKKQSYRNRSYILGANKMESLIVPVHASNGKTLMKDVRIDNHSNWQKIIWKTIEAAYKKAPFFEHYDFLFEPFFSKKYNFLVDLNVDNLTSCLKALGQTQPICLVEKDPELTILDLNAKKRDDISELYDFQPYTQNFGNVFVSNLSIIDMIFCCGPESSLYLDKTKKR